jgi:regulator of protease activity HflC (stomatin/prohibitin superfamily)
LERGRRFVIAEWERGVLFEDGRLVGELGPGPDRRWARSATLRRVDLRPWILDVPTQEVPTADGLTVKVTVVGRARVVDPVAYVTASQDSAASLYLQAQIAAREVVAGTTVEQLVTTRPAVGDALTALERARGETAALRNLANAASLLKDNPALLQLRLVQQLAATTGHTVVIGQAPLGA